MDTVMLIEAIVPKGSILMKNTKYRLKLAVHKPDNLQFGFDYFHCYILRCQIFICKAFLW